MIIYLLIFLTSLLLTLISLPYVIIILKKLDIVDKPDERKVHKIPVPTMGGIIIFLVTFLTLFAFMPDLNLLRLILFSASMLLICGMIDDWRGLDWSVKLLVQFAAAIPVVFFLAPGFDAVSLFTLLIPSPWCYIILTIFIVGAVNSINMIDGMDGLASGFAMIIFTLIFWMAYQINNNFLLIMCAALLGSTLGFLKFNASPAKVFLGDAGSLVLGIFIAIGTLLVSPNLSGGKILNLTFTTMLLGLPLVDMMKVVGIRLWKRKNPFLPDRNHLHYMLQDSNINSKKIIIILQLISVLCVILAYNYITGSELIAPVIFGVIASAIVLMKPAVKGIAILRTLLSEEKENSPSA